MKSIRHRIQLWYTLLLVVIVSGLMVALHHGRRAQLVTELDLELDEYKSTIISLAAPPPGPRRGQPPGSEHRQRPKVIELRERFEREKQFYHLAWRRNTEQVLKSEFAPDGIEPPGEVNRERRTRDGFREYLSLGPRGISLLAGASLAGVEAELLAYAWKLAAMGALIIASSFAIGWWILRIGLKPIQSISATAQEIASGDLSRRIDQKETDSELGNLVGALNDSFEKLESSFDQQRRFTADASHEMRTPVSVILAKAQYTLRKERSTEEYSQALQTCVDSARHMTDLIESLQQLAHIDSGRFTIERSPCDLAQIAGSAIEMLSPLSLERNIDLHTELSPCPCEVDEKRFRQVMINLISNAIKYNRDGGEVDVRCRALGDQCCIEVTDTGVGIEAEDLPHIFDRFYRADKARTVKGNTGLGLAITKAIIEAHGGTIEASSTPGGGSTFRIAIPQQG